MSKKDIIEELDDSIDKLEQLLGSDSGSDKDFKYFSNSSDSDLILDSDSENHHLSSTDNKQMWPKSLQVLHHWSLQRQKF